MGLFVNKVQVEKVGVWVIDNFLKVKSVGIMYSSVVRYFFIYYYQIDEVLQFLIGFILCQCLCWMVVDENGYYFVFQ